MKKMTRKVLALLLMAIMTIAMAAGCDKAEKSKKTSSDVKSGTVFSVMKQVSEMEQVSLETSVSFNIGGVKGDAVIKVKRDKDKASVGIEVNAAGMIFDLDDLLIVDGNTLYINVKEIESDLGALLSSAQIDLSMLGITSDWLSLTLDGMPENAGSYGTIFDDLDKAYKDMFTEKDGVYTLTIDDNDSFKAFADATRKLIADNKEAWADMIVEYYGSFDAKAMIEGMVNEISDKLVEKFKDTLGDAMDEDEIRDLVEDNIDMDLDDLETEINKDDIIVALEDAEEELENADYEDIEGVIELTSEVKKNESTITGKITNEDGEDMGFTMKAVKDTTGITVPSEADSAIDVLVDVLVKIYVSESDDTIDDEYFDMAW